jgi:hypothetical protein
MSLSGGDTGTAETIAVIRQLVDEGIKDPEVNRAAIGIVKAAGVRPFDFDGEQRAIYNFVLKQIRFTRDIAGKETLRTPREILAIRAGDCDDKSILIAALLGTIGHRVRLVTVKANPLAPGLFSHIYPEVYSRGRWVALDAARRDPALGRSPTKYFQKRVWSLTSDEYADVRGLNGLGFNWGTFADVAGKVTGSVTDVIRTIRAPASYITPPASPFTPYNPPATYPPYASPPYSAGGYPQAQPGLFDSMDQQTKLLLIGGGIFLLVMLMRK